MNNKHKEEPMICESCDKEYYEDIININEGRILCTECFEAETRGLSIIVDGDYGE